MIAIPQEFAGVKRFCTFLDRFDSSNAFLRCPQILSGLKHVMFPPCGAIKDAAATITCAHTDFRSDA